MHNHASRFRVLLQLIVASAWLPATPGLALDMSRVVEPPPPLYATGPTQTGRTWEMRMKSVEQVDFLCRSMLHGLPQGVRKGAYYMSCYNPKLDAVIIMDPKAWPSRREWEAIRAHEWAHARGWRHKADGEGTDWAASIPPRAGVLAASAEASGRPAAARTADRGPPSPP
jgi:hypothetical protein